MPRDTSVKRSAVRRPSTRSLIGGPPFPEQILMWWNSSPVLRTTSRRLALTGKIVDGSEKWQPTKALG